MPRRLGQLELDSTIETKRNLPLDARTLVRNKEELLHPDSFKYGYNGMLVVCRDEEKLYMLINKDDTTLESSWKEIGAVIIDGIDLSTLVSHDELKNVFDSIQFAGEADVDEIIYGINTDNTDNGQTPDNTEGGEPEEENPNEGDAP